MFMFSLTLFVLRSWTKFSHIPPLFWIRINGCRALHALRERLLDLELRWQSLVEGPLAGSCMPAVWGLMGTKNLLNL